MAAPQQADGEKAVRCQQQQGGQGDLRRYGCSHRYQLGLHIPHRQGRQHPPGHTEGEAYPAIQIQMGAAVIPKQHPQALFIQEMHRIFYRRTQDAPIKGQPPEALLSPGQAQYRRHSQAVHRAKGQQQKALAYPMPGPGDKGIRLFQPVPPKAVKKEKPKPLHIRSPPPSVFHRSR